MDFWIFNIYGWEDFFIIFDGDDSGYSFGIDMIVIWIFLIGGIFLFY